MEAWAAADMSLEGVKQYDESPETKECTPSDRPGGQILFGIVLERGVESAIEDNLGIDVRFTKCNKGLLILNVKRGLMCKWNEENPEYVAEVGDIIIDANGVGGCASKIMNEIISASILRLTVSAECAEVTGSELSDEDEEEGQGNAVDGITPLTTEALAAWDRSPQGRKYPFLLKAPQWEPEVKHKQKLKNQCLDVALAQPRTSSTVPTTAASSFNIASVHQASSSHQQALST